MTDRQLSGISSTGISSRGRENIVAIHAILREVAAAADYYVLDGEAIPLSPYKEE